MNKFEVWICDCHLRARSDGAQYRCQAAVWADGKDRFLATIEAHFEELGYSIDWLEEALPISQYLASPDLQHRPDPALAEKVDEGHCVEIGPISDSSTGRTIQVRDAISIDVIEKVTPLDSQLGADPKKTVPNTLYKPLFEQTEPTQTETDQYGSTEHIPPLRTYAILDGAKMPYLLTSLLEESKLRYQSLFQGKALDDLIEQAPYLVELEEGNNFTRKLFTAEEAQGLWDRELGVYIRTRATFEDARRHFRRFTRIKDEHGKWHFFAFWRTSIYHGIRSEDFLNPIVSEFFRQLIGGSSIYAVDATNGNVRCLVERDSSFQLLQPQKIPTIYKSILPIFKRSKVRENKRKITESLFDVLKKHEKLDREELSKLVDEVCDNCLRLYGVKGISHIKKICIWSHFLGIGFEERPEFSYVKKVLRRPGSEHRRLQNIEIWMRRWESEN